MSITHEELKTAQRIARDLRIMQDSEDEANPHPEELHRTAEKAARLIEEWALKLEWQQRDLERMRLLTRKQGESPWTNSCIHDAEDPRLMQKVQQLERENAALRRDVYQCPPTSENGYEGLKWADACEVIERDNAELHNKLVALQHQSQWQCSCGGTDCEGQKENAELRGDLEEALFERDEVKRVRYSLEDALTRSQVEAESCWGKKERLADAAEEVLRTYINVVRVTGHPCPEDLVICRQLRAAIDAARKEAKP